MMVDFAATRTPMLVRFVNDGTLGSGAGFATATHRQAPDLPRNATFRAEVENLFCVPHAVAPSIMMRVSP